MVRRLLKVEEGVVLGEIRGKVGAGLFWGMILVFLRYRIKMEVIIAGRKASFILGAESRLRKAGEVGSAERRQQLASGPKQW